MYHLLNCTTNFYTLCFDIAHLVCPLSNIHKMLPTWLHKQNKWFPVSTGTCDIYTVVNNKVNKSRNNYRVKLKMDHASGWEQNYRWSIEFQGWCWVPQVGWRTALESRHVEGTYWCPQWCKNHWRVGKWWSWRYPGILVHRMMFFSFKLVFIRPGFFLPGNSFPQQNKFLHPYSNHKTA